MAPMGHEPHGWSVFAEYSLLSLLQWTSFTVSQACRSAV